MFPLATSTFWNTVVEAACLAALTFVFVTAVFPDASGTVYRFTISQDRATVAPPAGGCR